jgi:hypothetical protein
MVGYKDLCQDCSGLVGGGPSLMPHAFLGPRPTEPGDRNSFRCLTCECDWRVSLGKGWRRVAAPS